MARGIISTILGGVAGGFEGLAADQKRKREEEERRLARETEAARYESEFGLRVLGAGGTLGSALRPDEGAKASQRLSSTVGRALDQAPLFERVEAGPAGTSALEAALQAEIPRPDFSAERRGVSQLTPMVEDEDYTQLTSPGGQAYSIMTPEARRRQGQADLEDERAYQRGIVENQRAFQQELIKNERAFDTKMAEFEANTRINLANLGLQNQLAVLSATKSYEDLLTVNPELAIRKSQEVFMGQILPRLISEEGGLDMLTIGQFANIFGAINGVDGPTFLGMVGLEDIAPSAEAPVATSLLPESGRLQGILEGAQQREINEQRRADRSAELTRLRAEINERLSAGGLDSRTASELRRLKNQIDSELATGSGSIYGVLGSGGR